MMLGLFYAALPLVLWLPPLVLMTWLGIRLPKHGPKREVDEDSARCRKCGYALRGLDNPQRCPECASDLTLRRAITYRRPFRWRQAYELHFCGGALVAIVWASTILELPWYSFPTADQLLRLTEEGNPDRVVHKAGLALAKRSIDQELSPQEHKRLALVILRNPEAFEHPSLWAGGFIVSAQTAGVLTYQRLYEELCAQVTVEVFEHEPLRKGESLLELRFVWPPHTSKIWFDRPVIDVTGATLTDVTGDRIAATAIDWFALRSEFDASGLLVGISADAPNATYSCDAHVRFGALESSVEVMRPFDVGRITLGAADGPPNDAIGEP